MKAGPLTYRRADNADHARATARQLGEGAKFMAGGQSLMPMMNLRLTLTQGIVDISRIAALRESRLENGRLFVGAGVTHAMIEDGKVPDPARGYLRRVAAGIAYRSIRNRGTLGGSLAHADPAADWPTALRALEAIAVIRGEAGPRQVPMERFQRGLMETDLAEGELLEGVLLPQLSAQARWGYRKFCHKVGEFAHSIGAVVVDPEQGLCNVVLGAAASRPLRLPGASARLAQGLSAGEASGASFAALVDADLAALIECPPDGEEFHLHRTMVLRAVAEAMKP